MSKCQKKNLSQNIDICPKNIYNHSISGGGVHEEAKYTEFD